MTGIDRLQTLTSRHKFASGRWRARVARTFLGTLAAAGILSSCSADYPVNAVFLEGRLAFVGAEKDWFFGETGFCPRYFSVRDESGKTVWRIENATDNVKCNIFPLFYGVVPEDWRPAVPAEPLKSGHLYIVNGAGGDQYHGAFRYRERRILGVTNEPDTAHRFERPPYDWPAEKALEPL